MAKKEIIIGFTAIKESVICMTTEFASNHYLSRDEARKLGRALISCADLADQLDLYRENEATK